MASIKTALCSFGMSGRLFHAPFIHAHPGFELHAVLERSKNDASSLYRNITTYKDIDALLADEAIALVIVNTPNATHYEFAKKALQAGKHVVVEKPFTVEPAEAAELINIAQENNRVLSVYHNRRWDSDYKTVKDIISKGLLGDIVEAEIHFDRYKIELSGKRHKELPAPGNGALYDLGSHLIDQALQLFGMPQAVFADIRTVRPNSQIDDYFEVLLYYPARRVRLKGTYIARETVPAYIIHGTSGSFLKSRSDIQEISLQNGKPVLDMDWGVDAASEHGLLHTETDGRIIKETVLSERGNYMAYYDHLFSAITEGKEAPVSAMDGMKVIQIIEVAFKSNAEKKMVALRYD